MSKGHEGRPTPLHHVGADDVGGPRRCCVVVSSAAPSRRPSAAFLDAHIAAVLPFVTLAYLFLINDTTLHVAAFGGEADFRSSIDSPPRGRLEKGPLLMWLGWMSLMAWLWRRPLPGESGQNSDAHDWRLRFMHLMSLTILLIAFSLDPFKATPAFFRGAGLNPLLQTDLMVIHPPLIFLTYALCLHLTAIALSAAYTGKTAEFGPRMLHLARPRLAGGDVGHRAGWFVGLPHPRLGRLLGVGPGRDRFFPAVVGPRDADSPAHPTRPCSAPRWDWRWTHHGVAGPVRHHRLPCGKRVGLLGSHLRLDDTSTAPATSLDD